VQMNYYKAISTSIPTHENSSGVLIPIKIVAFNKGSVYGRIGLGKTKNRNP